MLRNFDYSRRDERGFSPLAILVLLALAFFLSAGASHGQTSPTVTGVESIGMTVSDMDRAIDFYSRVLTFQKVSDVEVAGSDFERLQGVFGLRMRVVRMKLGEETLELTEYVAPSTGRPIPPDVKSNDRLFQHIAIIVSDMDKAYARLRENRVKHASTGPQRIPDWNKAAAGIRAFYFKDPDGHVLEILSFPSDKGPAKWHRTDRLFLGIDHTAIVVSDTESSLKFYRDTLGFKVAGASENYGDEQEHLNNVFGARLRITSIRAEHGPAIEFLEYLAPRDGRPASVDSKANDLWHWQTRLAVRDAEAGAAAIRSGAYKFVSPGTVALASDALSFRKGLLARDPDGHAMELVERPVPASVALTIPNWKLAGGSGAIRIYPPVQLSREENAHHAR